MSNVEYVDHLHIDEFPITSPHIQHQAHYYVHYLCYIFTGQKIHSWIEGKNRDGHFSGKPGLAVSSVFFQHLFWNKTIEREVARKKRVKALKETQSIDPN